MWTKTFHRIWFDEPERPEFAAWRDKLAELHPDWTIRTWDSSDEVRSLIDEAALTERWDAYMASDPFGRIPDIARYLLLWHFGGVYIDTDFEPLRPFDELLEDPRPFAAWENDRTMCTALLASPRKHPAIGILLEGLVDRLDATRGQTANNAVGPEYATAIWREREDVRRLPPSSFYPVGWWEKNLLGQVSYPPETYAVHHWAKGWGKPVETTVRQGTSDVSILVPFRDSDGSRTMLWDFVRERLERLYPEAEIIVTSDDGQDPFHKTLALNRAARQATKDVFVIYDSDTLVDIDALRTVVKIVSADPMKWGRPYTQKVKLNEAATQAVLDAGAGWDGTLDWRQYGRPEGQSGMNAAPPLVVSRQAWEIVRGFDERFSRGWGQEDVAFARSLEVLCGPSLRGHRGVAFHLNHQRIGVSGNDLWPGQDVEGKKYHIWLMAQYRKARTPDQMRQLLEERDDGRSPDDGNGDGETSRGVHAVGVR
jgi:glycosyl transferase-like sugar-binding protein